MEKSLTPIEWLEGYFNEFNCLSDRSLAVKKAFEKAKNDEKKLLKKAFCDGWNKSKTALFFNKREYYAEKYVTKNK